MKRQRCLKCEIEIDVYDDVVECLNCALVMRVLSWDPVKLEAIKDSPPNEVRIDYETETVNTTDVNVVVANEQTREINISNQARALRCLRFTDYVLVLLCGFGVWSFLLEVVFDPKLRQGGAWIVNSVILGTLCFSVYAGYRHVGVIDNHVWRLQTIAFPMLMIPCVLGTVLLALLLLINRTGIKVENVKASDIIAALIICFCLGATALLGFVSVLLLRRMVIAPFGTQLVELLSYLRSHRCRQVPCAANVERVNTPLGWLCGICGGLLILGSITPENLRGDSDFLAISQHLGLLGFFLLVRARRYFQVSADSLLSVDKRPPILFLRSFSDDEKQRYKTSSFKSLMDFSLETRLSNHFTCFGPFISLGSPRSAVPELGATRVILSDSKWQAKVMSWMTEARLIIMYSGKTHWINWELTKVIETERVSNLILVIPEITDRLYADRSEEISARIERLRDVFKSTRWSESLAGLQCLQDVRVLLFGGDGSMVVIRSGPRNRDSYHLAVLIAHYIILNQAAES